MGDGWRRMGADNPSTRAAAQPRSWCWVARILCLNQGSRAWHVDVSRGLDFTVRLIRTGRSPTRCRGLIRGSRSSRGASFVEGRCRTRVARSATPAYPDHKAAKAQRLRDAGREALIRINTSTEPDAVEKRNRRAARARERMLEARRWERLNGSEFDVDGYMRKSCRSSLRSRRRLCADHRAIREPRHSGATRGPKTAPDVLAIIARIRGRTPSVPRTLTVRRRSRRVPHDQLSSFGMHRQEVDNVRPVLAVRVAIAHQHRGDGVATGLVTDESVAEISADRRRERKQERAETRFVG